MNKPELNSKTRQKLNKKILVWQLLFQECACVCVYLAEIIWKFYQCFCCRVSLKYFITSRPKTYCTCSYNVCELIRWAQSDLWITLQSHRSWWLKHAPPVCRLLSYVGGHFPSICATIFHFISSCGSNGNYCDLLHWLAGTSFAGVA